MQKNRMDVFVWKRTGRCKKCNMVKTGTIEDLGG